MPTIHHSRLSVEGFMTPFLAALWLKGKREIWIRTDSARIERRRMHALYDFLHRKVEESVGKPTEWQLFIVYLRNTCIPGATGSFEGFIHQIALRQITITSLELPYCEYYGIELCGASARSILERETTPEVKQLVEEAATAYMSASEQ